MSYYGLVDYMVWAHLKWGLAMLYKVFINEWLADTKETQQNIILRKGKEAMCWSAENVQIFILNYINSSF